MHMSTLEKLQNLMNKLAEQDEWVDYLRDELEEGRVTNFEAHMAERKQTRLLAKVRKQMSKYLKETDGV